MGDVATQPNSDKKSAVTIHTQISQSAQDWCRTIATGKAISLMGTTQENDRLWRSFNQLYHAAPHRNLLVFIDGTANQAQSNTNIWQLYSLATAHACSTPNITFYHPGLGTTRGSRLWGAIIGKGIDDHIKATYQFLAETYKPGDRIYIFGFSRGAYTARALNGFIEFSGLLNPEAPWKSSHSITLKEKIKLLFNAYRVANDGQPQFSLRLKNQLARTNSGLVFTGADSAFVEAIGVFDTVPALGIERDDDPDDYRTELYAHRGYHALALDEQRDDFRPLRFDYRITPKQTLKEMWFAGAHADVGGGYSPHQIPGATGDLSNISLRWMLQQFSADDLFPTELNKLHCEDCAYAPLHDEYFENYRLFSVFGLHRRQPLPGDLMHSSVLCRYNSPQLPRANPYREPRKLYRPENVYLPLQDHYKLTDDPC